MIVSAFRVNMRDGQTISLDLETAEGREEWRKLRLTQADEIRGLALISHGMHFAVPLPQKFDNVVFDAEPVEHRDGSGRIVADAIRLYVDDVCVQLLVYRGDRSKMTRLSVERGGHPVFIPSLEEEQEAP